ASARRRNKFDGCQAIFHGVCKGENAGAAPASAVMKKQDIPACSAKRVRDIEIRFITGKTVKKNRDRMRPLSGCEQKTRKKGAATRLKDERNERRRKIGVRFWGIHDDRIEISHRP